VVEPVGRAFGEEAVALRVGVGAEAYANSTLSFRPKAKATCSNNWMVTEDWSGANSRSSAAGLVFMRLASFAREMRRRFISRSICHATTRLSAPASHSASAPSCLRKSSKSEPMCCSFMGLE